MTSRRTAVVTEPERDRRGTARAAGRRGFRRRRCCAAARPARRSGAEIGATAYTLDVTSPESVSAFARRAACDVLVKMPVGQGLTSVRGVDDEQWRWMYETNVIGMMRVPGAAAVDRRRGNGHIVLLDPSPAASYEVVPATRCKHAGRAVNETLRLELPASRYDHRGRGGHGGDDFSLLRFGGTPNGRRRRTRA